MTVSPPDTDGRILTVDALRGIALFGILYVHMMMWYTAGPLPQTLFKTISVASGIAMALFGVAFYKQILFVLLVPFWIEFLSPDEKPRKTR